MKKPRLRTLVMFFLAGMSGVLLLRVSQNVHQAEYKLQLLEGSLKKQQEALRVLDAEWAYLNSPQRLEALAKEHLDLVPPVPGQVLEDSNQLPEDLSGQDAVFQNENMAQPVSYGSQNREGGR